MVRFINQSLSLGALALVFLAFAVYPLSASGAIDKGDQGYFGRLVPPAPQAETSLKQAAADWYKDAIFYHVWLHAFADSDGDGVGDLRGVTARLPYLQELGVTALWLSPFWKSPSTHGYDVVDFYQVDPRYGGEAELRELLQAAHARGMSVIFDFVPNHVSTQHPWFKDSQDYANGKRNWFLWSNFIPARGWEDFGGRSAWRGLGSDPRNPGSTQFYYAIFWDQMPDLNYREPAVRAAMAGVVRHWLDFGFDGTRVDAVRYLFEAPGSGANVDQPENFEFFKKLREEVFEPYRELGYPKFMVGENWTDSSQGLLKYMSSDGKANDGLHATLEFPFGGMAYAAARGVVSTPASVKLAHQKLIQPAEAAGAWTFTFLSNHDNYQSRPLTDLGTAARVRIAQTLQMTLWGTPVLYYGNEIGMEGSNGNDQNMRQPFPWQKIEALKADPDSLWTWQSQLNRLRREHESLRRGTLKLLPAPERVLAFVRSSAAESLLVVVNLSPQAQAAFTLDLGDSDLNGQISCLVGDAAASSLDGKSLKVGELGARAVRIWQLNRAGLAPVRGDF